MRYCAPNLLLCILPIIFPLLNAFGVELDSEEMRRLRQDIIKAEIHYICNPFFIEYRKSLDEIVKVIPFDIEFDDVPNLKKRIMQYRSHIVTLLDDLKNDGNDVKSVRDDNNQPLIQVYGNVLKRFDDDHLVFKAEFVQCLVNGDDLSSEAGEYVKTIYFNILTQIRELPDDDDHFEQRTKLSTQLTFYGLLLTGMSMDRYCHLKLGE